MRQFLTLLGAGMIGGLTFFILSTIYAPAVTVTEEAPMVHQVAESNSVVNTPFDFVEASKKSTAVVVHIYAEESEISAQKRVQKNRRRSPFYDFFGGDDFFGGSPFGNFYRQQTGTGSGVIVSNDGYIVTNNHVVGYADHIVVTLNDGRKLNAKKIGVDPSTDLAVIKIESDGNFQVLEYADSDQVDIGEWVLAVGNPFSYLKSTVTAGIVSAKGRDLDIIKDERSIEEFIQTDAVVNPGNSGGALVNAKGQLIGINTAIATPTGSYAGYSFAIPSNVVKRIVADIIENGDIERVNIGLAGYDLDERLVEEFDLSVNEGFYIAEVERGSSAQLSGVLPGDVLVKINNTDISTYSDMTEVMKYAKAGDTINIEVIRNDNRKKFGLKLRHSF